MLTAYCVCSGAPECYGERLMATAAPAGRPHARAGSLAALCLQAAGVASAPNQVSAATMMLRAGDDTLV